MRMRKQSAHMKQASPLNRKITRKVLEERGVFEDTYMIYTIGDGYDIDVTRIE